MPNKYMDVEALAQQACRDTRISDDFIYMNDDFFVMEPVEQLPRWYTGTLLDEYKQRAGVYGTHRFPYIAAFKNTDAMLRRIGVANPLDYSLHIPTIFNKRKRLIVSELRGTMLNRNGLLHSRSLYCNLFLSSPGEQHADVKYTGLDDKFERYPFMSTVDKSFAYGEIGKYIREKLKEKSQYEQ
jgi:hypothetical protein